MNCFLRRLLSARQSRLSIFGTPAINTSLLIVIGHFDTIPRV